MIDNVVDLFSDGIAHTVSTATRLFHNVELCEDE